MSIDLKAGVSIEGRVTRMGNAVPSANVMAKAQYWLASTASDAQGNFRLVGLPPGTYELTAMQFSVRARGVRKGVRAGATDVVIDMSESFR